MSLVLLVATRLSGISRDVSCATSASPESVMLRLCQTQNNNVQQSVLQETVITHQTPTTDFHSPLTDRLTLRQSLLRQVEVVRSLEGMLEFAVELELVVEERPSRPRLEERADITLSVLEPTGCL
jgi:hypothetical protein